MNITLERRLNDIENKLSELAATPITGTLAGGVKVIIGAAQFLTALFWAVLNLLPALYCSNSEKLRYAIVHIKHGLGNIVAGILEAIPFLGAAIYNQRKARLAQAIENLRFRTMHENKFLPYRALRRLDCNFTDEKLQKQFLEYLRKTSPSCDKQNISVHSQREQAQAMLNPIPKVST